MQYNVQDLRERDLRLKGVSLVSNMVSVIPDVDDAETIREGAKKIHMLHISFFPGCFSLIAPIMKFMKH